MSSIISFTSVRMSGMKPSVTSYATLGVGLAVVLTVGLTALAGMVGQPVVEVRQAGEEAAMKAAPVPPSLEREAGIGAAAPPGPGFGGGIGGGSSIAQEQRVVVEQPPARSDGLSVAIPYIAAAVAGSVAFVVTRKRTGL